MYTKSSIVHLSPYYQAIRGQVSGPSSAGGKGIDRVETKSFIIRISHLKAKYIFCQAYFLVILDP